MYGSAEISQCFCRSCCVFGGISFLRFPLAGLTHDKTIGRCTGIVATTGERLRAKDAVICNHSYLSSVQSSARVLHRTILITNQSIKPSEKEEVKSFYGALLFRTKTINVFLDYLSSPKQTR